MPSRPSIPLGLISVLSLLYLAAAPTFASPLKRLAFGSCAGQDEPQPIWDAVLAESPELWIWAGDNVYGDTEDMDMLRQKYGRLLAQPGYQRLRATGIPILGTWDDHDYGVNDGGAEYPQRKASQQVLLDFLGVAADSPRRQRDGVYHSQLFGEVGQRIQVIVLDTRYHRSPLLTFPRYPNDQRVYKPDTRPEATVLGEEQWAWLKGELLKPAELRLIVSSIQFVSAEHRFEKWMNFPREHERFLDLLRSTRAEGVVLLSGDRHHAELSRLDMPDFYPLFDLTASGINKSWPRTGAAASRPPEPNRYRVGRVFRGHHFGVVDVDWRQPDPRVRLSIVNQEGERPVDATFPLSTLSLEPASRLTSTDPPASAAEIRMDGSLADWSGAEAVAMDGELLHLRFETPKPVTLTQSPAAIHLLLDFDGDDTGTDHFLEAGTDLEVVFSPRREPGERGWRPILYAFDPNSRPLTSDDAALAAAPTHASRWFELRLSRAKLAEQLPAAAVGGPATAVVYWEDKETGELAVLSRVSTTLPDVRGEAADAKEAAALPAAPEGGLRVVSLNTLWGSQFETPEPFGRLLQVLEADIFLLQEWSNEFTSEAEVVGWFSEHVDATVEWQTMVSGTAGTWSGTLLVSRHPVRGRVPRWTPVEGGGWEFPARFAAAVVETPIGAVLAASVHLKSSGAIDTREDQRRLAEAEAVNRILVGMKSVAEAKYVVLGGDFNLLGSTEVVRRTARQLDLDGSPLSVAKPLVLGDEERIYTFGRQDPRSRLDYVLYSDSSLEVAHAFVLDTAILDDASLAAMSLESEDSNATDHLPVVVDLIP
ncbi:MAG: alkaline phosphatase D family protein [Acidobacteriota bacterium]